MPAEPQTDNQSNLPMNVERLHTEMRLLNLDELMQLKSIIALEVGNRLCDKIDRREHNIERLSDQVIELTQEQTTAIHVGKSQNHAQEAHASPQDNVVSRAEFEELKARLTALELATQSQVNKGRVNATPDSSSSFEHTTPSAEVDMLPRYADIPLPTQRISTPQSMAEAARSMAEAPRYERSPGPAVRSLPSKSSKPRLINLQDLPLDIALHILEFNRLHGLQPECGAFAG